LSTNAHIFGRHSSILPFAEFVYLPYRFITKLLESNPIRMHGCEGEGEGEDEGDGGCGNVVFSNIEGLILVLNISGIVWTLGESPRGGVMYSWFS
jgi:hypothetical protein